MTITNEERMIAVAYGIANKARRALSELRDDAPPILRRQLEKRALAPVAEYERLARRIMRLHPEQFSYHTPRT